MGTYLLLASSIRRVRSICLCVGCLKHWAVPTQIPFAFDLIRVPSISVFVCVLSPFWLCVSATYIIEKKTQQLSFSSNPVALFFTLFFPAGFCVFVQFVCVFPCILLHCLERKCTRTSSPPHSTHTDTRDRINSAVVWAS